MRSWLICLVAAVAFLAVYPDDCVFPCAYAFTITNPPTLVKPYVRIIDEHCLACWNATAQVAADMKLGTEFIQDDFSTEVYNANFVKFKIGWYDSQGVKHYVSTRVKVWYNQIATSNGAITFLEIFEIGEMDDATYGKQHPYRPQEDQLSMQDISVTSLLKLVNVFGNLNSNHGKDYSPHAIFMAKSSHNCVPMEIGLATEDGSNDYEVDGNFTLAGMPLRWDYEAFLNGAVLGLPVDIQVVTTNEHENGERWFETQLFNPLFIQSAGSQSRRRNVQHLPLSWPLVKIIGQQQQLKARYPKLTEEIDWIVQGQKLGLEQAKRVAL